MELKKKVTLVVLVTVFCASAIICSGCVNKSKDNKSFEAQYIRTNRRGIDEREYPVVSIIHSVEELEEYYETNKKIYDLERREKEYEGETIGFLNACDRYDEEYFKEQVLVLVLFYEGSGSIRHDVKNVCISDENNEKQCVIVINRGVGGFETTDEANWHIFIEPEKGVEIEDESQVNVEFRDVDEKNIKSSF